MPNAFDSMDPQSPPVVTHHTSYITHHIAHGMLFMVSWVSSIFTGMPSKLSELEVLSKSELGMALSHSLKGQSIKILAPSSV